MPLSIIQPSPALLHRVSSTETARHYHNLQALPDTDREVRARLNQLKAEIQPLQLQKQAIDNHAHRCIAGLFDLCMQ